MVTITMMFAYADDDREHGDDDQNDDDQDDADDQNACSVFFFPRHPVNGSPA